jgi:hypothetical protein
VHGAAYAHPLLLDQLEVIIGSVENAGKKDPKGYKKRAAKLLAAVPKVAFKDIPSDPTRDYLPTARHARKNTSIGSGRNSCSSSA